jgi:hypothetical protein
MVSTTQRRRVGWRRTDVSEAGGDGFVTMTSGQGLPKTIPHSYPSDYLDRWAVVGFGPFRGLGAQGGRSTIGAARRSPS